MSTQNTTAERSAIIIFLLALTLEAMAQQKKVAVWETKCSDNSITTFQSTMVRGGMETAVANAIDYIGYDRASFDAILKEHNFQRSGSVKDSDIRRLGEMAGVQYIIVPEANADGNDFYIIVKMLDVETGEFGAAYDALCTNSASEIRKACSNLGAKLLGNTGQKAKDTPSNPTPNNGIQETEVFTIVEEMPEFPGGMEKLTEYLSMNVRYPVEAREKGIQGRVFVKFVVEPDGSVSNVAVTRSAGDDSIDEEAVRVVQSMPKWKPGKQRGRPVRVSLIAPINFKLQ